LNLSRSTFYYQPARESDLNLELMRLIDEQYLKTPFYGWPKMTVYLQKLGYPINHKWVQRLMQVMGLQAVGPKPGTSQPASDHKIYPYLLRGLTITRPNQVWSADITYVPLSGGFMYLVAIIDWFSRYVLAWQLSNTLDGHFCIQALQQALQRSQPEIFNTDQGLNSRRWPLLVSWKRSTFGSVWMVGGEPWITFLLSGCGARSSTKIFT
jgi:putative transposase